MANYKTTRLLVCCVFDRIWSNTQWLEDLYWFGPENALRRVWGVVFLLYCSRAQVLKVQRGAYKPSSGVFSRSWTPWSPTVSYVGVFPFIVQGGASCLHISIVVSWFRPGVLHLCQSSGPARPVGGGEACVRLIFLGDGLSSCRPVPDHSGWHGVAEPLWITPDQVRYIF